MNAVTISFWNNNHVCSFFVTGTFLYLVTSYTITKKEISKYNNWFLFIYVMCKDWGVTIIKYMICDVWFSLYVELLHTSAYIHTENKISQTTVRDTHISQIYSETEIWYIIPDKLFISLICISIVLF
jgi:hypothetical protein